MDGDKLTAKDEAYWIVRGLLAQVDPRGWVDTTPSSLAAHVVVRLEERGLLAGAEK